MPRVSVIRDEEIIPLLPVRPVHASLRSPLPGLIIEKHSIGSLEIPWHKHPTYCLHLQTDDTVDFEWWSDGKHGGAKTSPGSLIVLGLGSEDRLRWSGSTRRHLVSLNEQLMLRAMEGLERSGLPEIKSHWNLYDRQLEALILEIGAEMESGWPTGLLYGDLLGMAFTVALIQKCSTTSVPIPRATGGLPSSRLRRVLNYIDENVANEVRLDDLAHVAGLSAFHFARIFRTSTNMTPHQYLTERRIERAKALLQDERRGVADIALECGYPSGSHLARAFRKITGASPSEWRHDI
jgi:AraC family transcriptional regulator